MAKRLAALISVLCLLALLAMAAQERPEEHVHDYLVTTVAATCTESGYRSVVCSCGGRYIRKLGQPLGHSYVTYTTEPTCHEPGRTTQVCTVCGFSTVSDYGDALGHRMYANIQVFGDSISDNTWGDRRTWVDAMPGSVSLDNRAVGGAALTSVADKDNCVTKLLMDGVTLDAERDVIVIFAGTNDWAGEIPNLGTLHDGDSATVYGALENMIGYIRQRSDAKILVVTPMQRNNASDQARGSFDELGNPLNKRSYSLEQFALAIEEVCRCYDIFCLDLYHDSGVTRENVYLYTTDGLHPNTQGDQRVADMVCAALEDMGFAVRLGPPYVTQPTCTGEGFTTGACVLCGELFRDMYTQPLGHTFSDWETGEDLTTETRACPCGETETRPI